MNGTICQTDAQFDQILPQLKHEIQAAPRVLVDTETTGLNMYAATNPAKMAGIALGTPDGMRAYIAFRHGTGANVSLDRLQALRDILAGKPWVGHNIHFDCKILYNEGFLLPPSIEDSLLAAHLANENETSFALKPLARLYLGADSTSAEEALMERLKLAKLDKGGMWQLDAADVGEYALADIDLAYKLLENRRWELVKWRLESLYTEVCEFRMALLRMEMRGIQLDRAQVEAQRAALGPRIAELEQRLASLSGGINIRSPKQLAAWLGIDSTAKKVLEEILERTPREDIRTLLDYRALFKADSTYFTPFLEMTDNFDRIHSNFKVHGTVTGRLSSSEPNLQQLSRDQKGRQYSVRSCFTAAPGYFLVECDYSAIEPRIAAHYSGDDTMRQAFLQGHDFHTTVAKSMFKKDRISKEERTSAKTLGLGVLYGMGSAKAAINLGLRHTREPTGDWTWHYEPVWTVDPESGELTKVDCSHISREFCTAAGRMYIHKFYEGLPELQPFIRAVQNTAARNGYIRNPISGRCRRFTDARGIHKAFNSLIQSTAAEILRRALVRLDREFTENPGGPRMVLTVHDSIVFEVPFTMHAEAFIEQIKYIMEHTTELSVPLAVDVKFGYSLGSMAEYEHRRENGHSNGC